MARKDQPKIPRRGGVGETGLRYTRCMARRRPAPLRVLIVDDHPSFRSALSTALSMEAGIEVAGQAGGGEEACHQALRLHPDAIVMDLAMPDLDGIGAMRRIHAAAPGIPVVILTADADAGAERDARAAGAYGFLAKGSGLRELVGLLRGSADAA